MKVFIRAVRKTAEASTGHWQLRNRACPDFVLEEEYE
jgi:ribosomal protein L32